MERQTYLFVILFLMCYTFSFSETHHSIYNAYKKSDMAQWKLSMDSLEGSFLKTKKGRLELLNYQYGYIAWCIDQKKTKQAKYYLEKAEKLVSDLESEKNNLSMLYAYKAAFIGFKIGIAPYKAPFIGGQSAAYAEKAVDLDSLNALGHALLGNIAYYTPVIFGGSKKQAIKHYLNALRIMETQSSVYSNNWNYLNLLGTIIQYYIELKEFKIAESYCKKTLSVAPDFDWVKNKLYPQVVKGLKS